eukprot:767809-Hanusia_phi.AAC.2
MHSKDFQTKEDDTGFSEAKGVMGARSIYRLGQGVKGSDWQWRKGRKVVRCWRRGKDGQNERV